MKKENIKDEIGVIICENCNEKDDCNVYTCRYLNVLEEKLYRLFKKLKEGR